MELFPFIFGCQICYRYKSKQFCQNLVAMAMLTHTSLRLWNVPRAQPFDFWGGRGRYGWFDLGKISFFLTLWWHVFFLPWHTTSLYVRYFLERYFSFEISLQDIFFHWITHPHLPSQKSNGWPQFQRFFFHFFARLSGHSLNQVKLFLSLCCYFVSFSVSSFVWGKSPESETKKLSSLTPTPRRRL